MLPLSWKVMNIVWGLPSKKADIPWLLTLNLTSFHAMHMLRKPVPQNIVVSFLEVCRQSAAAAIVPACHRAGSVVDGWSKTSWMSVMRSNAVCVASELRGKRSCNAVWGRQFKGSGSMTHYQYGHIGTSQTIRRKRPLNTHGLRISQTLNNLGNIKEIR